MKPLIKNLLFGLIGMALFTSPAIGQVAHQTGANPTVLFAVLFGGAVFAYLFTPRSDDGRTIATNGVQVEIWAQYIIDRFWKDNQFLTRAYSDDQYVLAGKIVHIPQPGVKPVITKNRNSFPATAVRRTDTDIVYVLDEYTAAPTHIEDAEKYEVSYDKISSIYGDHAGTLVEFVADDLILKWLDESVTSPTKLYTTGGPTAAVTAATSPAATGNRYAFDHRDLRKVQLNFNANNLPKNDRNVMLESNMLDQFVNSLSDTQYRQFSEYYDAKNGTIGRLYGFDILDRSSVAVADNTNAIKALGAAGATTDSTVSIAWQKDSVTRAMGDVKFFANENRPEYYGDIYSSLLRMGARRRRGDDLGVVALIQGTPA